MANAVLSPEDTIPDHLSIARLGVTGVNDPSYAPSGGHPGVAQLFFDGPADARLIDARLTPDGQILIAKTSSYNGTVPALLQRLTSDGVNDTSFASSGRLTFNGYFHPGEMVVQPNGATPRGRQRANHSG